MWGLQGAAGAGLELRRNQTPACNAYKREKRTVDKTPAAFPGCGRYGSRSFFALVFSIDVVAYSQAPSLVNTMVVYMPTIEDWGSLSGIDP